ncbi:N-6 DNA methylase [Tenacibaculum sp. MAR_2009_124]|uniref:N-6 DNA methylase n=1 Tax=Tenacibaculum sp. MAR_2009_124 TaxID=1250059 RepID=UPI000B803B70|nr:N-6 DNA methylase [Tenacibaculum sp. MAR_2009_124]
MKLSKKKYLQYIIQTIEAINNSNNFKNTFINNPGFGRIFDIIKSEKDFQLLEQTLNKFYGEQYSQTVLSSLKQASLTSYFTPDPLVDLIVNFLNKNNTFLPKTILEPAAGNGAFVKSLLKVFPQAKYTAFEKDVITSSIFSHNFQNNKNVTLYGIPFEVHANTDAPKTYDLIISNIPFGSASVFDPSISHYEDDYVIKKSLHGYFSFKINTLLNPKGIAVIITTKNLLDREKNQKIRQQIINQSNFIGGFRLPNDTFEKENTKVVTDLLFFQNNQGLITTKEQKDLNQLFIDTKAINVGDNKVSYSAYFKEYPENVLGEIIEGGLYHNRIILSTLLTIVLNIT